MTTLTAAENKTVSTNYFDIKIYKENVHLKFKRRDLVRKIEQIGGTSTLASNMH